MFHEREINKLKEVHKKEIDYLTVEIEKLKQKVLTLKK